MTAAHLRTGPSPGRPISLTLRKTSLARLGIKTDKKGADNQPAKKEELKKSSPADIPSDPDAPPGAKKLGVGRAPGIDLAATFHAHNDKFIRPRVGQKFVHARPKPKQKAAGK